MVFGWLYACVCVCVSVSVSLLRNSKNHVISHTHTHSRSRRLQQGACLLAHHKLNRFRRPNRPNNVCDALTHNVHQHFRMVLRTHTHTFAHLSTVEPRRRHHTTHTHLKPAASTASGRVTTRGPTAPVVVVVLGSLICLLRLCLVAAGRLVWCRRRVHTHTHTVLAMMEFIPERIRRRRRRRR